MCIKVLVLGGGVLGLGGGSAYFIFMGALKIPEGSYLKFSVTEFCEITRKL